jgi:hypothetical protein
MLSWWVYYQYKIKKIRNHRVTSGYISVSKGIISEFIKLATYFAGCQNTLNLYPTPVPKLMYIIKKQYGGRESGCYFAQRLGLIPRKRFSSCKRAIQTEAETVAGT